MTEVPKIVHDRLRAVALDRESPARNAAETNHTDPDLLTAFAEQSLSATERDGVLEHLVLCADCRETVALALPAENVVAIPIFPERDAIHAPAKPGPSGVFAWPTLRLAALAAGIVVVGSILLLHPGKLNQSNQPSASRQTASNATPPSAVSQATVASPSAASAITSSADANRTVPANTDEAKLVTVPSLAKESQPPRFTARRSGEPPQAENTMLLARNKKSSQQSGQLANLPGSRALALDDSAGQERAGEPGRSAETTEGSAASDLSPSSADTALMANSDAPVIAKAKPAMPGTTQMDGLAPSDADQQKEIDSALAPALPARAKSSAAGLGVAPSPTSAPGFAQHDVAQNNFAWTISAGVLRRSQDNGQTWQENLHVDHPLLSYATRGNDIWTGGQSGTVYHSADDGATWVQVHPAFNGRRLTSDITQIDLRSTNLAGNNLGSNDTDTQGSAKIALSTRNNEIWLSVDGGKTWEIK